MAQFAIRIVIIEPCFDQTPQNSVQPHSFGTSGAPSRPPGCHVGSKLPAVREALPQPWHGMLWRIAVHGGDYRARGRCHGDCRVPAQTTVSVASGGAIRVIVRYCDQHDHVAERCARLSPSPVDRNYGDDTTGGT